MRMIRWLEFASGFSTASGACCRRRPRVVALVALSLAVGSAAGCSSAMTSWFNGFLDPSEVGSYGPFGREATLDIRSSLSLQDAPSGVSALSEPQPEDLVPVVQEYKYRVGDSLNVRVYELLQRGTETAIQALVDETGSISIPVVGRFEVAGLTLPEIEAEVVDQLVRRGVLVDPQVIVEPAVRRGMSYTIYGTISQPNLYPLGQYDLRLLDAINIAGGLLDQVTEVYVVRGQKPVEPVLMSRSTVPGSVEARVLDGGLTLSDGQARGGLYAAAGRSGGRAVPPEPEGGEAPATRESGSGRAPVPVDEATPATPSVPQWIYRTGEWVDTRPRPSEAATTTAAPAVESAPAARRDLIETMIGPDQASSAATTPAVEPVPPSPSQPRWIYYNGRWIETAAPSSLPAEPPASGPAPVPAPVAEPPTQPAIDWSQVAGVNDHRVIKVSGSGLREGDPRQNIVVRAGDAIRVASGEFGEYYVMGQVQRPGAYSLTGRTITLKTAIAAAGNLAPLAWPANCTVYRRLGDREQMIQLNLDAIFAGREQDCFLKQDDLILVGTHPVAPFLAVLRNAFRASYGFGFVYDRNFADIDSYNQKINPDNLPKQNPNLFR